MISSKRPVRRDHPRLARILGFAGTLVLIISIIIDPYDPATDWLGMRLLQIALTALVSCFGLRSYKITTQFEFNIWGAAIVALSNIWLVAAAWLTGFANGPIVGLFIVINVSNYMLPDGKFVLFYTLTLAISLTVAVFTAPNILIDPVLALSAFYFYLLVGLVAMTKILADRDRLEASEEILKEARDKAEDAAQARHEFMTNMSHELRTPLNGIIGMTNLLDRSKLEDSQKDMIGTIEMSGQLLLSLINGILDYAKLEATGITITKSENEIENSCAQCLELVMPLAMKKGVGLYLDIEPSLPKTLVFDSIKVSQVLVNLLNNALKFTDSGSVILSICLENREDGESFLACLVKDTGVGIPEEQQKLIFEEFSQGDLSPTRKFGGTGLGLTICKRLLDAMGGTIQVDSVVGKGSTFTAKIPVERKGKNSLINPADEELATSLEEQSCLLLIGDKIQKNIVERKLESWGITINVVEAAAGLIEHLEEKGSPSSLPSFIICDLDSISLDPSDLEKELKQIYRQHRCNLIFIAHTKDIESNARLTSLPINPLRLSNLRNRMVSALSQTAEGTRGNRLNSKNLTGTDKEKQLKILVAEDNQINQKVALALLRNLGLSAELATNGLEATEKVRGTEYDLVLMDVQMPEMDGLTATREIRKGKGNQPTIVAMTANAFEQDKIACLEAGMDSFIAKPISIDAVKSALELARQKSKSP